MAAIWGRPRAAAAPGSAWFLIGAAIALASVSGAVISLGIKVFDVLLVGLYAGVIFLFVPLTWVFWVLVALTFVVIGQLQYFGKIAQGHWIPYLMALMLYLRLPFELLRRNLTVRSISLPAFCVALGLFAVIVVLSTALNASPFLQTLVGFKNFLFMWSLMLLFALGSLPEASLRRLWLVMIFVALLQLPFAVYQHFFVAAKAVHTSLASWDAVVGTFGGNAEGGGASGVLAVFLVITAVLAVTLRRRGQIGTPLVAAVLLANLATALLAEIKVVFVLLPIAVTLLNRRELWRKPVQSAVAILASFAVVVVLFFAYKQLYWETAKGQSMSISTALDSLDYATRADDHVMNSMTREVGRAQAVSIWWRENQSKDVAALMLGHGPAASRVSATMGYGAAAKKYPFDLTTSSVSVLLWDVGILGLLSFGTILVLGALAASRLSRDARIPPFHAAVLDAAFVALVLFLIALPYNRDAVDAPAAQLLLVLFLGHVAYWHGACPGTDRFRAPMQKAAE